MDMKFEDKNDRLSLNEVKYWKHFFMSNLKIGVELESDFSREISGTDFHSELRSYLKPSNGYGSFGKFGVGQVKSDGSLSNGCEICTIGRRLGFLELYAQYKFITDKMIQKGAFVSPRAGLHNHVLLDYGNGWSCLEKPVPAIILKNFIQLLKMNAPELVWITSTMRIRDGNKWIITRYKNFCNHETLMNCRISGRNMEEIESRIEAGTRYQFINLGNLGIDTNNRNEIIRFHFELRFPDGSLYPAQIAAQNMLWAAMLIKAIKLSVTGVIGADERWEETKQLMNCIRTDNRMERASVPLTAEQEERVATRASEFIDMMKPELDIFDEKVYRILKFLAQTPISVMMRDSNTERVNEAFENIIQNMYMEEIDECDDLIELILTNRVTGHFSEYAWKTAAAEALGQTPQKIDSQITKINRNMQLRYDKLLGCYVIV